MNNTKIKYFEELTKFTYSTVLDGYNGSFMGCTNLERVDLTGKTHLSPRETSDKSSYGLFRGCSNLQTIGDISNINIIPYCAFHYCSKLKEKIITTATSLRGRCFEGCSQIPSIIILTSTVPSLTVTYGTIAIAGTTCPIYVRPELYKSFMVATNWSSYRSRIKNFFTGPVLIIKDGVYTYSLRTEAFEEYQGLTFSIDENDYLSLNFDGETATITASGIVSGVDEPVGVHYSFIYRGKEVSGTFNISVTYKEIIDFEDAEVKRICVANWGGEYCASTNKYGVPGELTMEQALGSPARKAASVLSRLKFVTLTRTFSTTIPIYGLRYSYPGRNLGDCSVRFNTDTGHTIQVYCYYSRCWYVDGNGYSDLFSLWINLGSNKYLSFFSDSVSNPYVSAHVTFDNVIGYRPSEYDGRISALVDSNDI